MISEEDIKKAAETLRNIPFYSGPPMFFTGGTGIPCQMVIDYFKDTNIIVITRDGTKYQYGKKMEEK